MKRLGVWIGTLALTGVAMWVAVAVAWGGASTVEASAAPGRYVAAPTTTPLQSLTPDEAAIVADLNETRVEAGLAPVEVAADLNASAEQWSTEVADTGLRHSELEEPEGAAVCWVKLGENIAQGTSVDEIVDAWIASPTHLANLVDPGFTHVGVSIVEDASGTLFATQEFMQAGVPGVDC